jgi:methionyl-tRNA formyltransferase
VTEVATVPISRPIRIVVFGTPDYAVPALRGLANSSQFEVAQAVTQPDRSGGRRGMIEPAVKTAANELGLPVIQPATLRDEAVREQLRAIGADLFVVAAYGLIFSQEVLDIPLSGCVNLHASILPAYRGAAPIPAAILNSDPETGVTLMMMERGLDKGPIVAIERTPIEPTDTTETLTSRLAQIGADMAVQLLPDLVDGEIVPTPQPDGATAVRQLTKADGQIDWTRSALDISRQVRAMWPWPRAWTEIEGRQLQIHAAAVVESAAEGSAGVVVIEGGHPIIGCGIGALLIERGQVAGGKPISGRDLISGRALKSGDQCSPLDEPPPPLVRAVEQSR